MNHQLITENIVTITMSNNYTELDNIAYYLYATKSKKFGLTDKNVFIDYKNVFYMTYYDEALLILRNIKIKKIKNRNK